MDIVTRGAVAADFDALKYGSIFIGKCADEPGFHAIKAVEVDRNRDHVVIVGPFLRDDEGVPGAYSSGILERPDCVLDVTSCCAFLPSLKTEHVDATASRRGVGQVFLTSEGGVLLRIRMWQARPTWQPAFLDVSTGKISAAPPTGPLVATSHWSLVTTTEPRTVLFEHPPP